MADKPSEKKTALREALDEIDQRVETPKYNARKKAEYDKAVADAQKAASGPRHRSIEERQAAALERLAKAYNKGESEDVREEIEKINLISQANAANIGGVVDDVKTIGGAAKAAGATVSNARAAYNTVKAKMSADAGRLGAKSLIGKAAQNLFEFPVFVSSSVPLDYATAVNSLLEQMYASFLQMAVSINPVVSASDVKSGKMFQGLKTDVTKFMEYAEYDWQKAACHNVVHMEDSIVEFDMINIPDDECRMIVEAAEYDLMDSFSHYFTEASSSNPRHVIDRLEDQISELEDEEDQLLDDRRTGVIDNAGLKRLPELRRELSQLRRNVSDERRRLGQSSDRAAAEKERRANEAERKANEAHRESERQLSAEERRKAQEHRDQLTRETEEEKRRRYRREDEEDQRRREDHQINMNENRRAREKHKVDMKVKAPQMLDETKINKMNTMKPLMMTVGFKVLGDDGRVSDMIDYIVGVRTHCRIVKAEVLPDVAEYPLKEMSTLTRKAKWRAGEIKFLDFLFAKKEKKQAAYDSRDVNRKWYHRLYTLAHSKGSKSIAGKITGKRTNEGLIPNATIVITKADVDMIKAEKGIDLLRASSARAFCNELFLMSFIVVDVDAQSIKILLPDINNDFEVQSLGAVQKQIATLDTSGAVSDSVTKLMRGR